MSSWPTANEWASLALRSFRAPTHASVATQRFAIADRTNYTRLLVSREAWSALASAIRRMPRIGTGASLERSTTHHAAEGAAEPFRDPGEHRRDPAAGGGRDRADTGQLAAPRVLRRPVRTPSRTGRAAPGSAAVGVGRGRTAGGVLLRRGRRTQTRIVRRQPAPAEGGRGSGVRRGRRDDRAGRAVRRLAARPGRPRSTARLGNPDGDRSLSRSLCSQSSDAACLAHCGPSC